MESGLYHCYTESRETQRPKKLILTYVLSYLYQHLIENAPHERAINHSKVLNDIEEFTRPPHPKSCIWFTKNDDGIHPKHDPTLQTPPPRWYIETFSLYLPRTEDAVELGNAQQRKRFLPNSPDSIHISGPQRRDHESEASLDRKLES